MDKFLEIGLKNEIKVNPDQIPDSSGTSGMKKCLRSIGGYNMLE
jgi:hypothetical protein